MEMTEKHNWGEKVYVYNSYYQYQKFQYERDRKVVRDPGIRNSWIETPTLDSFECISINDNVEVVHCKREGCRPLQLFFLLDQQSDWLREWWDRLRSQHYVLKEVLLKK